jgi:hypothetical protein
MGKKLASTPSMLVLVAFAAAAVSCGKGEPVDPYAIVPDPQGTATANISEETAIVVNVTVNGENRQVGFIGWLPLNNFVIGTYDPSYHAYICDLDSMRGLGNIRHPVQSAAYVDLGDYSKSTACKIGHGYVIRFSSSTSSGSSVYVRLYVVGEFLNIWGEIIGAEVKYQYPF